MSDVTYPIYSGGEPITNRLTAPLDDLQVARGLARDVSRATTQRDSTITVRSLKPEPGGAWRGLAAVFINGDEIAPDDERYPHELVP
jgi:hypothetical protein